MSISAEAQLMMLKEAIGSACYLHEAQANQLRGWPFHIDELIKHGKVDPETNKIVGSGVDLSPDFDKKQIVYHWNTTRPKSWSPDATYILGILRLEKNIKWLLGEAWTVVVSVDGKPIFPVDTSRVQSTNTPRKRRVTRKRRK